MPSPPHDSPPSAETILATKLNPSQLRAVAQWLRTIAQHYEHQAPADVSQSFRIQAQHLDQLARQHQPDQDIIKGTLMSAKQAYWITATGECFYQSLTDNHRDGNTRDRTATDSFPAALAESLPERCTISELRQAYKSRHFSIVLGAAFLAERFGPRPE